VSSLESSGSPPAVVGVGTTGVAGAAGGGTSTIGGEGRARGDLTSPLESTSKITPSPTSTK
jgi:hypothetical protein